MRRLIWPVLFLFLIVVQGASSVFYSGWLAFDLPLLFLYSFALLRGQDKGALAGFGIGFVQDSMTVGVFGYHMLTRAIFGFLVGLMKEKIVKEQSRFHVLIIGGACFFMRFCYWWLELIRSGGRWDILPTFIWKSLGYCLGNMLFIIPMLILVNYIYAWIKAEDVSY